MASHRKQKDDIMVMETKLDMVDTFYAGKTVVLFAGCELKPDSFGRIIVNIKVKYPLHIPFRKKGKRTFKTQRPNCKNHSKKRHLAINAHASVERYHAPLFNIYKHGN